MFKKETNYLSSGYNAPFTILGSEFSSIDHFCNYIKFQGTPHGEEILNAKSPIKIKILSSKTNILLKPGETIDERFQEQYPVRNGYYTIRNDWGKIKNEVLKKAIKEKFKQNPNLQKKLMVESNITSDLLKQYKKQSLKINPQPTSLSVEKDEQLTLIPYQLNTNTLTIPITDANKNDLLKMGCTIQPSDPTVAHFPICMYNDVDDYLNQVKSETTKKEEFLMDQLNFHLDQIQLVPNANEKIEMCIRTMSGYTSEMRKPTKLNVNDKYPDLLTEIIYGHFKHISREFKMRGREFNIPISRFSNPSEIHIQKAIDHVKEYLDCNTKKALLFLLPPELRNGVHQYSQHNMISPTECIHLLEEHSQMDGFGDEVKNRIYHYCLKMLPYEEGLQIEAYIGKHPSRDGSEKINDIWILDAEDENVATKINDFIYSQQIKIFGYDPEYTDLVKKIAPNQHLALFYEFNIENDGVSEAYESSKDDTSQDDSSSVKYNTSKDDDVVTEGLNESSEESGEEMFVPKTEKPAFTEEKVKQGLFHPRSALEQSVIQPENWKRLLCNEWSETIELEDKQFPSVNHYYFYKFVKAFEDENNMQNTMSGKFLTSEYRGVGEICGIKAKELFMRLDKLFKKKYGEKWELFIDNWYSSGKAEEVMMSGLQEKFKKEKYSKILEQTREHNVPLFHQFILRGKFISKDNFAYKWGVIITDQNSLLQNMNSENLTTININQNFIVVGENKLGKLLEKIRMGDTSGVDTSGIDTSGIKPEILIDTPSEEEMNF